MLRRPALARSLRVRHAFIAGLSLAMACAGGADPAVAPVTLAFGSGPLTLAVGEMRTAVVRIVGGRTTPTLASCTVDLPAVVTARAVGDACEITAIGAGSATVTARLSTNETATLAITVAAPQCNLAALRVTPGLVSLYVNDTLRLTPNAPSVGASPVVTTFSYLSLAPDIATVGATGLVRGVAPGAAVVRVTATTTGPCATRSAEVPVTVVARQAGLTDLAIALQPGTQPLQRFDVRQLSVTPVGPAASSAALTFTSSAPTVVSVTSTGLVTAVAAGTARLTVTAVAPESGPFGAATVSRTLDVTVLPAAPAVTNFAFDPVAPPPIVVGTTLPLVATWRAGAGAMVSVTYTSSRPDIATVSGTGIVTGVEPGTSVITATLRGSGPQLETIVETRSITVTVPAREPGLLQLFLRATRGEFSPGQTYQLIPDPTGPVANLATVTYVSDDPSVATVTANGLVRAVGFGSTRIRVIATSPQSGRYAATTLTSFFTVDVVAGQ